MIIHVKCLNGKIFTFSVSPQTTILSLKDALKNITYMKIEHQYLYFGKKLLFDRCNMSDYNLHTHDKLCLTFRLKTTSVDNITHELSSIKII